MLYKAHWGFFLNLTKELTPYTALLFKNFLHTENTVFQIYPTDAHENQKKQTRFETLFGDFLYVEINCTHRCSEQCKNVCLVNWSFYLGEPSTNDSALLVKGPLLLTL